MLILIWALHAVVAQEPRAPQYTNCSVVPTGQLFGVYALDDLNAEFAAQYNYKTACDNTPTGDQGTCIVPAPGVVSLYERPATFNTDGPFLSISAFNCTRCAFCACPTSRLRGQTSGQCCDDVSGGPGCMCPRRAPHTCATTGGVNAGQCSTTGFLPASDFDTPLATTSLGLARSHNQLGDTARTTLVGVPSSILMLNMFLAFPRKVDQCGVLFNTVIIYKYTKDANPGEIVPCMDGILLQATPIRFDANFGTIEVRRIPVSFSQTLFLVPARVDNTNILIAQTVNVPDPNNPPELIQGFYITGFDTSRGMWETPGSVTIWYRVTNVGASILHMVAGTLLKIRSSPAPHSCTIVGACGQSNFGPANSLPAVTSVPASFLSTSAYSTEMTPKLTSSTPGDNVTMWTFIAAVLPVGGVYCSSGIALDPGFIMTIGLNAYATAPPSKTELEACQANWVICNGPITFTRIPLGSTTAIRVDINYNVVTGDVPKFPETSVPLYLTVTTTENALFNGGTTFLTFLSVQQGDAFGNPFGIQTGIDLIQSDPAEFAQILRMTVLVSAQNLDGFRGGSIGTTWCVVQSDTCSVLLLQQTNDFSGCFSFVAAVAGPVPVQIADCDTCHDCLCDALEAERGGNGTMCCPPFFMGYQCSINTHTSCSTIQAGSICSENGNSSFPGNVNGTGCYLANGHYQCSCLDEYLPPTCLLRVDTTCGFPLCNNHGNCTVSSDPRFDNHACFCDSGYRGPHCQYPVLECFTSLDAPVCSGHGFCNDPDIAGFGTPDCICDDLYTGLYCEQSMMTTCVDPLSGMPCASSGLCITTQPCMLPFPAVQRAGVPATTLAFQAFTSFSILSLSDVVASDSEVFGTIGLSPGHTVTGLTDPIVVNVTSGDILAQVAVVNAQPCTSTVSASTVTGTYTAGVYCFPTATAFGFVVTLNARNNPSSTFVFRLSGAVSMDSSCEFILLNGALPENVFVTSGTLVTAPNSRLIGIWIASSISVGRHTLTGMIVSTGVSTVTLSGSTLVAAPPSEPEGACATPVTAFDGCNATGLLDFCASRVGVGKRLLTTDVEYMAQTFTLPEMECMASNFSIVRGFSIMSYFKNFCIIDVQTTTLFFFGTNTPQIDNVFVCTEVVHRVNSALRLYVFTPQYPYIISEVCYDTSAIATTPVIGQAMLEAVFTRVRVGATPDDPLEARRHLLQTCQDLAQRTNSPYYGIDTGVSRCWLPSVFSPAPSVPPTTALNGVPDFVYATDIDNLNAIQFWYATTDSI